MELHSRVLKQKLCMRTHGYLGMLSKPFTTTNNSALHPRFQRGYACQAQHAGPTRRAWYKTPSASSNFSCSHSMSARLEATALIMPGLPCCFTRYCSTCLCTRSPCSLLLHAIKTRLRAGHRCPACIVRLPNWTATFIRSFVIHDFLSWRQLQQWTAAPGSELVHPGPCLLPHNTGGFRPHKHDAELDVNLLLALCVCVCNWQRQ